MAGQIIMSSVVQTTDWMVKTVKLFYILLWAGLVSPASAVLVVLCSAAATLLLL